MNLTSLRLIAAASTTTMVITAFGACKLMPQDDLKRTQSALIEEAKESCPNSNIKFNNKLQLSNSISFDKPLFAPNADTFACKEGVRVYDFKNEVVKTFSTSGGIRTEGMNDLASIGRVAKYRAELAIGAAVEAAKDSAVLKSLSKLR